MYSPTYLSAVIVVLSQILPLVGINVGSEALTTTISTIVAIVAGIVIAFRKYSEGNINAMGKRSQ